jgi:Single Cache domain 2
VLIARGLKCGVFAFPGEIGMSKSSFAVAAAIAAALLWSAAAIGAQQLGTADEAKAMLDRAVVALKADKAAALAQFNDKSNKQFHEHDLYVFCFNLRDGRIVAHPNPALVDTDARAFNFKGDPIGQRIFDGAKGPSLTAVDYLFPKPGTTEPAPKESFVTQVGELGCGVGYYK